MWFIISFENSRYQQDLARPLPLISVVGGGFGRGEAGMSAGREAAFKYVCAKSWYLITSLPRWWDRFSCCSISDRCHLVGPAALQEGPRTLASRTPQQAWAAGAHMCMYPTQRFCSSYIIMNHSRPELSVLFHYWSTVFIPFHSCVTMRFVPQSWKSNENSLRYFEYNFTSSMSLSVHQIRSHCLYVTAAGLSCCLQGRVFSLDENIHIHTLTHTLSLTLSSVSLGSFACAMTHRAKNAKNRTDQLHSPTVLPGLMDSIGQKQWCYVVHDS